MATPTLMAMALGTRLAAGPALYVFRDSPTEGTPWALIVAGGSWQRRVSLPTLVFVLAHPQGLTLIDAGYGSRFGEVARQFPANVFYAIAHVAWGPPRATLPQQLAGCGLAPEQVRRILVTHGHVDHVGGCVDFPAAEVVMSAAEGRSFAQRAPGFLQTSLAGRLRLVELATARPFGIFPHGQDLFGDGSVVLLDTHGHTPGHMAVFVRLGSGRRVLLAGDTAWVRDHYVRMQPRGWPTSMLVDAGPNEDSLRLLHHLSQVDPELTVIPSHDPEIEAELPVPPDRLD
ncbi:MAG TPA: MBL fold metallo-hydrolase [Stenomitos sp.]